MVNFQQGRAEKQDHEPREHGNVGPACHTAPTYPGLPQSVHQQTANARFQLADYLTDISDDQLAHAYWKSAAPKLESPPYAVNENHDGCHCQPVEKNHRGMGYIAESLAGRSHFLNFSINSGTIW